MMPVLPGSIILHSGDSETRKNSIPLIAIPSAPDLPGSIKTTKFHLTLWQFPFSALAEIHDFGKIEFLSTLVWPKKNGT